MDTHLAKLFGPLIAYLLFSCAPPHAPATRHATEPSFASLSPTATPQPSPTPSPPPPPTPQYRPCIDGPTWLRQIDDWEQQGLGASIERFGRPITPEEYAEILISDCSDQLARLNAAAAILEEPVAEAIVRSFGTNLEFMKWWLHNRRTKIPSQQPGRRRP
jgi:hypothetical protein